MADINFTKNFKVDLGSFRILNTLNSGNFKTENILIKIEMENGISLLRFCSLINEIIQKSCIFTLYTDNCKQENLPILKYTDFMEKEMHEKMLEKVNLPF